MLIFAQEEILQTHSDVTESAVFGIKDELKGQLPFGFVVVGKHIEDKPEEFARVERECVQLVRKELGPVAAFKLCKVIYRLPKTRSGKTLRGTMSRIADGEDFNVCGYPVPCPHCLANVHQSLWHARIVDVMAKKVLNLYFRQIPATIDDVRTLDLVREGLEGAGVISNADKTANGSQ